MTQNAPSPDTIALKLLAWGDRHGRRDLPWQIDPTPYRVWISEVMLQQTQVTTVLPYYERFTGRFPDVATLATATLDEVLHTWTGLGYYARARNLHRAARAVMQEHDGRLPTDIDTLRRLPGIGRSTAGAILALSSGWRHPILDGNARRVLARVFAVDGDPAGSTTQKRLWALADACMPSNRVSQYTQAIMDLGAGVCTRNQPRCDACPLDTVCLAHRTRREQELPSPRRRRARPRRTACALVIRDVTGALLVQKRGEDALWGGLWSLPQFDSEPEALNWLADHFPTATGVNALGSQHHAFTHYRLDLSLIAADVDARPISACIWYDPQQAPLLGLTKAVTRVVTNTM